MLLFWWFIHSSGLKIGSPVEKWCLCLLPLSMGSVTAWLIVEHGKVHVLHPDLEELGSFHFLLLRTFTLGTWVSCVRGSQNCLGESSLYQFACHVNEPSREWVSSPATSILNALGFPVFSRARSMRLELKKQFLWYFCSWLQCSSF